MKVIVNIPSDMYKQLMVAARVEKCSVADVILRVLEEANDGCTEDAWGE